MPSFFGKKFPRVQSRGLETTALSDLSGGLNQIDEDVNMSPVFAVDLVNMRRTSSGAQAVRFGTHWEFDISSTVNENIVDGVYFNGRHIIVTEGGHVLAVTDAGVATIIWSEAIANALAGSPSGWGSSFVAVNFVPFKTQLIVHNGVDKPIIIDDDFTVDYLQDLATGSNTNTPIGQYGCVVGNYHVVAGIPATPTSIVISNTATAGTFPGDAAPNDSVTIDVGAYTSQDTSQIRGIAGYRNTTLVVFFATQALLITLGVYDADGNHTPSFDDTLPRFGLLGHRCIVPLENDAIFADLLGVSKLSRNLTSGLKQSQRLSALVLPHIEEHLTDMTDSERLYEAFMVENSLDQEIWLFLQGQVHVRHAENYSKGLRRDAWTRFEDWTYTAAWRSLLGRIFLAEGTRVYQYGNGVFSGENYAADKLLDRDGDWANATAYAAGDIAYDTVTGESYVCLTDHVSSATGTFEENRENHPTRWSLYEGGAISAVYETPWIPGRDPWRTNKLRYLALKTKGTSAFTVDAYVDELYKDADGNVLYDPAATITFMGNQALGFGYDAGPYGGGRRSGDPRLYNFPLKFKSVKFRITASTRKPLTLASILFLYQRGNYER